MRYLLYFVTVLISISPIYSCRNYPQEMKSFVFTDCESENSLIDSLRDFSVGNSNFSFTVDLTGLQTFPDYCRAGTSYLREQGTSLSVRSNRLNPGQIGLDILKAGVKKISINDITEPHQKLNFLTGVIESRFFVDGIVVSVQTVCHPHYNMISVRIKSKLLSLTRLNVNFNFDTDANPDNQAPEGKELSELVSDTNNIALLRRNAWHDSCYVLIWKNSAVLKHISNDKYSLVPVNGDSVFSFSCQFMSDHSESRIQTFGETLKASSKKWTGYQQAFMDSCILNSHDKSAVYLHAKVIKNYFKRIGCRAPLN